MMPQKRVFILGAGFSKPANMPLATELLECLKLRLTNEAREWLNGLTRRVAWLNRPPSRKSKSPRHDFSVNIEELFDIAPFDIEAFRLKQHFCKVGREHGSSTPWNTSTRIANHLRQLEDALRDEICERECNANLEPVLKWSNQLTPNDTVLTFNYDTLVERSLNNKPLQHHFGTNPDTNGLTVCKLHGSIDWIVAHRLTELSPDKFELIFDKPNINRRDGDRDTGHIEEDQRLWRCRTPEALTEWIEGRDLQWVSNGETTREVGIAGLGRHKPLHNIPGLGQIWATGMRALAEADFAVVVGFSMSEFDKMAQIQFAEVVKDRLTRPLRVAVVDPYIDEFGKRRFRRVFGKMDFVMKPHQSITDWSRFPPN